MRRFSVLSCLLLAAACSSGSPTTPSSAVDVQAVLAPGQTINAAPDLSVRFVNVSGDSRCPADALCITGGDAIVRIVVTTRTAGAERELHTGDMRPVTHDGATIELIRLDPYPFSTGPIDPADYRLTVRVTR